MGAIAADVKVIATPAGEEQGRSTPQSRAVDNNRGGEVALAVWFPIAPPHRHLGVAGNVYNRHVT